MALMTFRTYQRTYNISVEIAHIRLCNFIEITLRHGCSPVNLLHIFRTPFTKNTSGQLLLFLDGTK